MVRPAVLKKFCNIGVEEFTEFTELQKSGRRKLRELNGSVFNGQFF
jgi:hypothetical protein